MSKTYWLHRTSISSMFINLDSKHNGLPTLMTFAEYSKVATDSRVSGSIYPLPHDLWLKQDKNTEEYIRILSEAGITLEDYLQVRQQNYQEQLNAYRSQLESITELYSRETAVHSNRVAYILVMKSQLDTMLNSLKSVQSKTNKQIPEELKTQFKDVTAIYQNAVSILFNKQKAETI